MPMHTYIYISTATIHFNGVLNVWYITGTAFKLKQNLKCKQNFTKITGIWLNIISVYCVYINILIASGELFAYRMQLY